MKPPPFNKDFFSAVSAIIPILFLALIVDTKTYRTLSRAQVAAVTSMISNFWLDALVTILGSIAAILSFGILVAGAWGEYLAIYALYQGQAGPVTQTAVLISTAFLLAAVAAGPVWTLGRTYYKGWRGEEDTDSS